MWERLGAGLFLLLLASGCAHSSRFAGKPSPHDEPSCALPAQDIERLQQFAQIKSYLQKEVFQPWSDAWPQMLFYDEKCQFILNYAGDAPQGFQEINQTLRLPGFVTDKIYTRKNEILLPANGALPTLIPAQAYTYGWEGTEKWFVMGLYPVWKRDFNDPEDFFFGVLAHEMFHPFQFTLKTLKGRMEKVSKAKFTTFYSENPEFAKQVDEELKLFDQAVKTVSTGQKKVLLKHILAKRSKRRLAFFRGKNEPMAKEEVMVETVEGTAEYMNFRVMTDSKRFPQSFGSFSKYRNITFEEALENVRSRPSYVQNIGVYSVILLNQLHPNWQSEAFQYEDGIEGLLRIAVHQ